VLATSAETGGALFAGNIRMQPGGGPPVMHRHDPGEVYYVLDGEFTFYIGGFGRPLQRVTATRGQVVPLAGGTPHTMRNESVADAVAFVVHAPGAPMETSPVRRRLGSRGQRQHGSRASDRPTPRH
jgi:mannose-6-phosphate isomerase-like protein (cupin superfamily)